MYAKVKGVDKDEKKAREWYEKAANKGSPSAQFNLGVMLSLVILVDREVLKKL